MGKFGVTQAYTLNRSSLEQTNGGLSIHMKLSMTGQEKGDLLIQVAA